MENYGSDHVVIFELRYRTRLDGESLLELSQSHREVLPMDGHGVSHLRELRVKNQWRRDTKVNEIWLILTDKSGGWRH